MSDPVALLVDIVRSRDLADRQGAQTLVEELFARIHAVRPFLEPARATVGDELQAVSPDLAHALWVTDVALLERRDPPALRFGLGSGEMTRLRSDAGPLPEGSAWWNARAAVDRAQQLAEVGRTAFVRSWYVGPQDEGVNSFLVLRDDRIAGMSSEERALAAGRLLGRTQSELAAELGVTQSAVSQRLAGSGGRALEIADAQVAR